MAALPRARAAAEQSPVYVRPGEERSGALLLRCDGDRFVEAPLVATDVDMMVSGPTAAEGQGLSKPWARRKIADAEVARTLHHATPEETDRRILALALDHHLVSRLTSLVAVDATPSRPAGVHLTRAELPLDLPAGWEFDKVFGTSGEGPRDSARRREDRTDAAPGVQLADATASARVPQPRAGATPVSLNQGGLVLPKTATDAEIR